MADLEGFYAAARGDYEGVLARFRSPERVEKFVRFFSMDQSYQTLVAAMEAGDAETAFRASHTLKGTSRDIGLTVLGETADEVCESLRGATTVDSAVPLMGPCTEAYERVTEALNTYVL